MNVHKLVRYLVNKRGFRVDKAMELVSTNTQHFREISEFSQCLGSCIVDTTNRYGVRSSKRTAEIHTCISKFIEKINPTLTCKIEQSLAISTGTYDADIVAFKDGERKLIVSFKANLNNIKQNVTNNENVKGGELLKIFNSSPHSKIVFLDVIPVECPYYESNGHIKCMEVNTPTKIREKNTNLLRILSPGGLMLCTGIFTLFTKNKYITRTNLEFEGIVDMDDMFGFVEIIRSL